LAFLLGMPVLIEGPEHGEGLAVEHEAPVLRLESAEPDRASGRVDDPPVVNKFDREIVKRGRVRRPRIGIGDVEACFELRRGQLKLALSHRLAQAGQRQPGDRRRFAGQRSFRGDGSALKVVGALNREFGEVNGIARLEPRRLPDAALHPVPILLAGERLAEAPAVAVIGDPRVDAEHERGPAP
jgi:hypothetical protein